MLNISLNDSLVILTAISSVAAICAVGMVALWLRRCKRAVAMTLGIAEQANQQTVKHVHDVLMQLQKQAHQQAMQIEALAQAGLRLRQEIVNVSARLDQNGPPIRDIKDTPPTMH